MSNRDLRLQKILSNDPLSDRDIKAYALESFATEIDYRIQTELLMKLILDHSSIAKRIERLNEELLQSRAMLSEAQEIAQLGRWDIHPTSGSMTWSKSMYDLLELDPPFQHRPICSFPWFIPMTFNLSPRCSARCSSRKNHGVLGIVC